MSRHAAISRLLAPGGENIAGSALLRILIQAHP